MLLHMLQSAPAVPNASTPCVHDRLRAVVRAGLRDPRDAERQKRPGDPACSVLRAVPSPIRLSNGRRFSPARGPRCGRMLTTGRSRPAKPAPFRMAVEARTVADACAQARGGRACWRQSTRPRRTPRCGPSPMSARRTWTRSSRPTPATSRTAARPKLGALIDRLTLDEERIRAMAAGVHDRRAARPDRRGVRVPHALQRLATAPGAVPLGVVTIVYGRGRT